MCLFFKNEQSTFKKSNFMQKFPEDLESPDLPVLEL
jgi:hypothetical protein